MQVSTFEKPRREELGIAGGRVNYDKLDVDGFVSPAQVRILTQLLVHKNKYRRNDKPDVDGFVSPAQG